jgi:hypothetical protein
MFCALGLVFDGVQFVGSVFMFCAPGLVFGYTEGVKSGFHVLRSWTHFRWYRGRLLLFSCFPRPDSFSVVPRASNPVFMFCAPGLIFDDIEGVRSRFHVSRSWIYFQRYRGRRLPFSCFARPDSFSMEPRALHPVFMFFVPKHVFSGVEGLVSCFHVLPSRARFRRFRGRRVPFSCFALPSTFSAVSRASGPVSMFSAPGPVFGGTDGFGSRFHVLPSRARFQRFRWGHVPFSCFALPSTVSAVSCVSGPIFIICAPRLIFGGSEGVVSRFHILLALTHF